MEKLGIDFSEEFDGVFQGKRVLVTGHTGFKGSWLSVWLSMLGCEVIGYALDPLNDLDNFVLCGLDDKLTDIRGDIRDKKHLDEVFKTYKPEIVFHLAAQPIVRTSYSLPSETFETNIMGTVNLLECVRNSDCVMACIIVTSDKCYENREQIWGYREDDPLGGFDPYSASKGCAEIVSSAYRRSYNMAVSSVRAGNVIGGGDWSNQRIIPDCIRALQKGEAIEVRNPDSVRPWQFVLEPLYGYLLTASKMLADPIKYSGAWNFGPDFDSIVSVSHIVKKVIEIWGSGQWKDMSGSYAPHEAGLLNLDCTKSKTYLGFRQRLSLEDTLKQTLEWYKEYKNGNVLEICIKQIAYYCRLI